MTVPKLDKISELVTALKLYSDGRAESCRGQHLTHILDIPRLASWDAMDWYELMQDWELIDFLVSGTAEADLLVKSLQSCFQWYEKGVRNKILETMRIIN
ncbi:MAG: hypothetical protein ACLPX5_04880 [Dissulfurispiraceae bacterium]